MAKDAEGQALGAGRSLLLGQGFSTLPAWWSADGRPGWVPDSDLGTGFPWTLAGHVRGAWALEEPGRPPRGMPFPDVTAVGSSLVSYDTVTVTNGQGAAWRGFAAALATARGMAVVDTVEGDTLRAGRRWARSDLMLANGSSAYSDNALVVGRGDSASALLIEVTSWTRGASGPLDDAGRHQYGFGGFLSSGRHRIDGAFGHRGMASRLNGGEEEAAGGESGRLNYRLDAGGLVARFGVARGTTHHETFGALLPYARRDGQETEAVVELERGGGDDRLEVRAEWRRARLGYAQAEPGSDIPGDAGSRRADVLWGAARWERALGEGRLDASLGVGRHGAIDRPEIAPSLAYRFAGRPFQGRLLLERVLAPVWADLAAGQSPFLQSTWTGGFEISGIGATRRGNVSLRVGRSRDRALASRLPLEGLWLRAGFAADPGDYDFALVGASGEWRARHMAVGGEGFALARDRSPIQSQVDPGHGARGFVEGRFRTFGNDLGVTVRAEASALGPRESEASLSRRLEGYVSFGGTAEFALADALVVIRIRNLEDHRRPQTWVDSATGLEALGPGREMRVTLTWRMFN